MTTCIPHRHGGADDVAAAVDHWTLLLDAPVHEALDVELLVGRNLMLDDGIVTHPLRPDMTLPSLVLVEQLEERATPRAATLLRTLALLAAGPLAEASAAAVDRLAARGIEIESRFAAVGQATPLRAWAYPGKRRPEGVLVEYDYAGERPHAFAVTFDSPERGTEVEIGLMDAPGLREADWPSLEPIALDAAFELIDDAIAVADQFDLEHVRPYGALLWSRVIRALDAEAA